MFCFLFAVTKENSVLNIWTAGALHAVNGSDADFCPKLVVITAS